MGHFKHLGKIVGVAAIFITIDHFRITNPVLISYCKITTQFKIPAQESIDIEKVDIFVKTVDERTGECF